MTHSVLVSLLFFLTSYSWGAGLKTLDFSIGEARYQIHYPESKKDFALRTFDIAQEVFPKIHKYFGYSPLSTTHFVIESSSSANGAANVFPRNQIILYDYPPVGWGNLRIEILVVHEYTHILTLEMTRSWIKPLRSILGSTVKFAGILPRWISEGVAVWAESYFTKEGRIRNPLVRKSVIDSLKDPRSCKSLDCLDYNKIIPHGNYPYHMGGHFLNFLEKRSPGFNSCLFKVHSSQLPFLMGRAFRKCGGKSATGLFEDFKKSMKSQKSPCLLKAQSRCDYLESLISRDIRVDWTKGFIELESKGAFIISSKPGSKAHLSRSRELMIVDWKKQVFAKSPLSLPVEKIYQFDNRKKNEFFLTSIKREFGQSQRVHQHFIFDSNRLKKKKSYVKKEAYIFPTGESFQYKDSHWVFKNKKSEISYPSLLNIYAPKTTRKGAIIQSRHPLNQLEVEDETVKDISRSEKPYSPFSHLRYSHLFLLLRQDTNLVLGSVSTTLSDPKNLVSLFLEGRAYGGIEDDANPLRFSTNLGFNLWKLRTNISYSERLGQISSSSQTDIFTTLGLSLSKNFQHKYSRSSLGLILNDASENSVLGGARDSNFLGFRYSWNYSASKQNAFLRSISWRNTFGHETNSLNIDHSRYRGSLNTRWGLTGPLSFFTRFQYARNFKTSFQGGLIQGGGASSSLTGTFPYDSYQFDFGTVAGNELRSLRLGFDYSLFSPERGRGLLPVNFKDLIFNLGLESIGSDRVFSPVTGNFEVDEQVSSWFTGFNFRWDIGYRFPLDIRFIYSSALDERFEDNRFHFLIEAPLLF